MQLKAEMERKESRHTERMAKPRPQKAEQPVEIPQPQQEPVIQEQMPNHSLTTSCDESSMQENPIPNSPKTTPSSRGKKFNSLIKAKERHDRNRLKRRSHHHSHAM